MYALGVLIAEGRSFLKHNQKCLFTTLLSASKLKLLLIRKIRQKGGQRETEIKNCYQTVMHKRRELLVFISGDYGDII